MCTFVPMSVKQHSSIHPPTHPIKLILEVQIRGKEDALLDKSFLNLVCPLRLLSYKYYGYPDSHPPTRIIIKYEVAEAVIC